MRDFGSKVRGEDTPESDIDVFIEIDNINSVIESEIDDIVYKINLENAHIYINNNFWKKRDRKKAQCQNLLFIKSFGKRECLFDR